jgi:hypothetical protein
MSEASSPSQRRTSVSGGSGSQPTAANNVTGVGSSGDKSFHKGGSHDLLNEGPGHVVVRINTCLRILELVCLDCVRLTHSLR